MTSEERKVTFDDRGWGSVIDEKCPANTYLAGIKVRLEPRQGGGDDTGINGAYLQCRNKAGTLSEIKMTDHGWGSIKEHTCKEGEYLSGLSVRTEPSLGGGSDDSGTNGLKAFCQNIRDENKAPTEHVIGDNGWGSWVTHQGTPNEYVCGVSVRQEPKQGGGDDTAVNGFWLTFCKKEGSGTGLEFNEDWFLSDEDLAAEKEKSSSMTKKAANEAKNNGKTGSTPPPTTPPSPPPTTPPSPPPTTPPSPPPTTPPSPPPTTPPSPPPTPTGGGIPTWVWLVLGALILTAVVFIVVVVARGGGGSTYYPPPRPPPPPGYY